MIPRDNNKMANVLSAIKLRERFAFRLGFGLRPKFGIDLPLTLRVILLALSASLSLVAAEPSTALSSAQADGQLNVGRSGEALTLRLEAWQSSYFDARDALLVETNDRALLLSQNADAPMVPASTMKIFTALLALQTWGDTYHWPTRFQINGSTLTVVGNGDPFLVSEELLKVAQKLASLITLPITHIVVDTSMFADEPVPGRSLVSDPYNAPMSAIAANFNTVQLRRTSAGFESGEDQTPLTAIATELAVREAKQKSWPLGAVKRVNLINAENSHRQFAELLIKFVQQVEPTAVAKNVLISYSSSAPMNQSVGDTSNQIEYRHLNSRPLEEVLVGALKYSNNFITNQLFLSLSEVHPKNFAATQRWVKDNVKSQFAWTNYSVLDGSGLSADNRLSATQMSDVLALFSARYELLPMTQYAQWNAKVYAKTGTLNNVRTLAGYIVMGDQRYHFSYFFNRSLAWKHREDTLAALVKVLAQPTQ
jgi:D-alanyl-D-alanine carboxypeptidase/D-alanyl-D-alanine-endopeptidase (penicillin-binding protein 4)